MRSNWKTRVRGWVCEFLVRKPPILESARPWAAQHNYPFGTLFGPEKSLGYPWAAQTNYIFGILFGPDNSLDDPCMAQTNYPLRTLFGPEKVKCRLPNEFGYFVQKVRFGFRSERSVLASKLIWVLRGTELFAWGKYDKLPTIQKIRKMLLPFS